MRGRAGGLLLLLGCAGPGDPGYQRCDPYEPQEGCVLWLCYEVVSRTEIDRWVEWDNAGVTDSANCNEPTCAAALEVALEQGCDLELD
jgi:hypothetical protein